MTDLPTTEPPRRPRRKHVRRHITTPDGVEWWPRKEIADDKIGEDERTLRRRNPPTTYISGVAYCPLDETLRIVLTDRARRRNQPQPPKRHRRGGR